MQVANFCFTNLLVQQQRQLGVLVTALTAVEPQVRSYVRLIDFCITRL